MGPATGHWRLGWWRSSWRVHQGPGGASPGLSQIPDQDGSLRSLTMVPTSLDGAQHGPRGQQCPGEYSKFYSLVRQGTVTRLEDPCDTKPLVHEQQSRRRGSWGDGSQAGGVGRVAIPQAEWKYCSIKQAVWTWRSVYASRLWGRGRPGGAECKEAHRVSRRVC